MQLSNQEAIVDNVKRDLGPGNISPILVAI